MMKKFVYFSGFSLLIFLVLLVAVFYATREPLGRFAGNRLAQNLQKSGVTFSFKSSYLSFPPSLTVRGASFFLPKAFLSLSMDEINASPNYSLLMIGKKSLKLSSSFYGGRVDAIVSEMGPDNIQGQINLASVSLVDHPQLSGLGLKSGVLNIFVPEFSFNHSVIVAKSVALSVENASLPEGVKIPAYGILIPPLDNLHFKGEFGVSNNSINVRNSSLITSLGEASVVGNVSRLIIDIKIKASLTQNGIKYIGLILPILSSGKLTGKERNFNVTVSGSISRPKAVFSQ